MDALDTGVFESHSEYEKQRNARHYFWRVINGYIDVRNTPPLTAINYDPSIRNPKLGADLIHFIVDVENASKKALGDNAVLLEQWQRLVRGDTVPNAASIIQKCARIYRARSLAPTDYFKFVKKGRKRHPDAAVQADGRT